MTDTTAPVPAPEAAGHSFLERILDGVERAGNKMPHPAILFLTLCIVVILLSQVLYWFDVKATFKVVEPPAVTTEQVYYGGSVEPTDVGPTTPEPATDYQLKTETVKVRGLLTGEGGRDACQRVSPDALERSTAQRDQYEVAGVRRNAGDDPEQHDDERQGAAG